MILTRKRSAGGRAGFTLIELMVSAALAVTIMWILAESFKMGLDFARSARSTGDMMTQLNNVGQIATRDLQANHFLAGGAATNNVGKLSGQRLDLLGTAGNPAQAQGYVPPNGYFQIFSPQQQFVGVDPEGLAVNTATNHFLQFTAYVPGGLLQNLFTTNSAGVSYSSRAAEVSYFLGSAGGAGVATGTTPPTPGLPPQNLFNLYRRQRLVAVTTDDVPSLTPPGSAPTFDGSDPSEVISMTGASVNTLSTFSGSNGLAARMPLAPLPQFLPSPPYPANTPNPRFGDDVLLTNVLSFEVLVNWNQNQSNVGGPSKNPPRSFTWPAASPNFPNLQNTDAPYDFLWPNSLNSNPATANLFDTWSQGANWNNMSAPNNGVVPMPIRVTGLQITIRVYDPKTMKARQNTWRIGM